MTLLEVMISIVILMVVAFPILNIYIKITNASNINDLRIAYAFIRGEVGIIYKTNNVSESVRSMHINDVDYFLSCSIKGRDGDMVLWSVEVKKSKKVIAGIQGVVYAPL